MAPRCHESGSESGFKILNVSYTSDSCYMDCVQREIHANCKCNKQFVRNEILEAKSDVYCNVTEI